MLVSTTKTDPKPDLISIRTPRGMTDSGENLPRMTQAVKPPSSSIQGLGWQKLKTTRSHTRGITCAVGASRIDECPVQLVCANPGEPGDDPRRRACAGAGVDERP
jgi:hypothetical protein